MKHDDLDMRIERALRNAEQPIAIDVPDGSSLLSSIVVFIRRFMILPDAETLAIALHAVHTHAFDAADETPYLHIASPVKRCGKSRLLELLDLLVAKPWLTGRVTPAVLLRKTHAEKPTLLLDEADAAFKGDKEYAEALRGLLNSGHRRGGTHSVCVASGKDWKTADFATFCPKVIAGIGGLPDTVADRSIPIRLERKARGDAVERFKRRIVEPQATMIRDAIEAWVSFNLDALRDARPALPDELDDRAQDGWEPLFAISDLCGDEYARRARIAAVRLSGEREQDDDSVHVQLLHDCRLVLESRGVERIASTDLANELSRLEEAPWGPERGQPFDARRLAKLLRTFGIKPKVLKIDGEPVRGYERLVFEVRGGLAPLRSASPPGERNERNNRLGSGFSAAATTVTGAFRLRLEKTA